MVRICYAIGIVICIWSCKLGPSYQLIGGQTMGTTYSIKVLGEEKIQQAEIDSILIEINNSVSTYIKTSDISRFNAASRGIQHVDLSNDYFIDNFEKSMALSAQTRGAFDPTVMPLVNYWGFGTTGKKTLTSVDSSTIESLRKVVGYEMVQQTRDSIIKDHPDVQLDFSAIAKGYAVDELCQYLDKKSITDYFVEIGGELRTKGVNDKGKSWTVGVNLPETTANLTDVIAYLRIPNRAMATSGNYRNYYEIQGKQYGHTIDPRTGYPASSLRSATIIGENCMTADALATAAMVLGLEKSMDLIRSSNNTEGLFVYSTEDGQLEIIQTDGMSKYRIDE